MTVADLIRERAAALGRPLGDVTDDELGARLVAMPLGASDDLDACVAWLTDGPPERPCGRCRWRPATVRAHDAPENDAALYFGDAALSILLCGGCLDITAAEGPWDRVEAMA